MPQAQRAVARWPQTSGLINRKHPQHRRDLKATFSCRVTVQPEC